MSKGFKTYDLLLKFSLLTLCLSNSSIGLADSPQCQVALQSIKNFRDIPAFKTSLADWAQALFAGRSFSQRFTEASNSGFVFSEVSAAFEKPFSILNSEELKTHAIMESLFPGMTFTPCASGGCRVSQSVGGFISRIDYTMDYRFLKIASPQEANDLSLPVEIFKNDFYPKYLMVQLGTDWTKFFNRTVAVTIFEGDPNNSNIIKTNAIQLLNLTMVGSMGKGTIENVLQAQVHEFVDIFESWAQEQANQAQSSN